MTWLIATKCLRHNLSLSNLVFSAFVTSPNIYCQWCFNLNNTTSATSGAETVDHYDEHDFTSGFLLDSCFSNFVCRVLFRVPLFVFLSVCLFANALGLFCIIFLFLITAYGYPFDIFKLSL